MEVEYPYAPTSVVFDEHNWLPDNGMIFSVRADLGWSADRPEVESLICWLIELGHDWAIEMVGELREQLDAATAIGWWTTMYEGVK